MKIDHYRSSHMSKLTHQVLKYFNTMTTSLFHDSFLSRKEALKRVGLISLFNGKQFQSILPCYVGRLVKRMAIFNMCHISEIHGMKDFKYTRIGLVIYVEFILGK